GGGRELPRRGPAAGAARAPGRGAGRGPDRRAAADHRAARRRLRDGRRVVVLRAPPHLDRAEVHPPPAATAVHGGGARPGRRGGAPPFLRPGWIEAWCGAYAASPVTVLQIRRSGELAGVLPLLPRHRTHAGPTNSHTPLFGLLAADPGAAGELAERFVDDVG